MNDELKKLQRQLEQATDNRAAADESEPLDEETASLGQAWLAFGQLLEAAQPSAEMPMPVPLRQHQRTTRRRTMVAVAITAASLAVAVTLGWYFVGTTPSGGPLPSPEMAATATPDPFDATEPGVAPSPLTEESDLAWDDSLDEQLATLGQSVIDIEEGWAYRDTAIDTLSSGIEHLESDFTNNGNTL